MILILALWKSRAKLLFGQLSLYIIRDKPPDQKPATRQLLSPIVKLKALDMMLPVDFFTDQTLGDWRTPYKSISETADTNICFMHNRKVD
jgi:hypothetical protein